MRLGAFETVEPVPQLENPHALAIIPSWLDAGGAANMAITYLEKKFGGSKMAKLARPGDYFDFTRYRPAVSINHGEIEFTVINAVVTYAHRLESNDFIFLRLPEPTSSAEGYIDSIIELLKHYGITRYGVLGAVYDMVPYTRPLMVTGSGSSQVLKTSLEVANVVSSDYEGPTSILSFIAQQLQQSGIETFSAVIHLPGYQTNDSDYRGQKGLLEVLGSLYGFALPQDLIEKAGEQQSQFIQVAEGFLQQQPQLKIMLKQLEENYDARINNHIGRVSLSPEVEEFLKEMNGRFEQG